MPSRGQSAQYVKGAVMGLGPVEDQLGRKDFVRKSVDVNSVSYKWVPWMVWRSRK